MMVFAKQSPSRAGIQRAPANPARPDASVGSNRGFTLIELLVVIAIIAILASMLLPSLSKAKSKGQGILCLNNAKQLQLCWQMYHEDNNDNLPPNESAVGGARDSWSSTARTWIKGNAFTDTDTRNIEAGVLFPYNKSAKIYKCPTDRSTVRDQGRIPRSRSVSMSMYMNYAPDDTTGICWRKSAQIRNPSPSAAFVFIDESEGSIENSRFYIHQPGVWTWVDFVSTRHNNGGVLSFADGHAEMWRWLESNTLRISKLKGWIQNQAAVQRTDRDLGRLQKAIPVTPIR